MRSFLVLVGFAIGVIGYAVVYDGAAALATAGSSGNILTNPPSWLPIPGAGGGVKLGGQGTKAFPWGRPGIINSLIPGKEKGDVSGHGEQGFQTSNPSTFQPLQVRQV